MIHLLASRRPEPVRIVLVAIVMIAYRASLIIEAIGRFITRLAGR